MSAKKMSGTVAGRLRINETDVIKSCGAAGEFQKLGAVQPLVELMHHVTFILSGFVCIVNGIVVVAVLKALLRLSKNCPLQPAQVLPLHGAQLVCRQVEMLAFFIEHKILGRLLE